MQHVQKGVSRNPSGRPKGIKDVRLLRLELQEKLKKAGCDPIQILIEFAMNKEGKYDDKLKQKSAESLLHKYIPDIRAIEIKQDEDQHNDLLDLKDKLMEACKAVRKEF